MRHFLGGVPTVAAAGGWTPASLSGVLAWFDADDAATFTYSSGSVVSQWADKSGNGNHATQGTVANQPSRSGTINGRSSVVFDGTTDRLIFPVLDSTKPTTVLAVVKWVSGLGTVLGMDGSGNGGLQLRTTGGGTVQALKAGVALIGQSTGVVTTNVAACLAFTYDGSGNYAFERDGAADGSGTNDQTFSNATNSALGVQSNAAPGELFVGEIAEFVKTSTVLSGSDLSDWASYCSTKWGTA